jgi:hypothetical protein
MDLRDSYEEALNWLRYRDEENAEDNAEAHAGDGTAPNGKPHPV